MWPPDCFVSAIESNSLCFEEEQTFLLCNCGDIGIGACGDGGPYDDGKGADRGSVRERGIRQVAQTWDVLLN